MKPLFEVNNLESLVFAILSRNTWSTSKTSPSPRGKASGYSKPL